MGHIEPDYQALLDENERLREREEQIVTQLASLLDGGIWPVPAAVKLLGGREIIRRALDPGMGYD